MALDPEKIAEIEETFVHFDRDLNGVIDLQEFGELLDALQANMTPEETDIGFREVDVNNNGKISFNEFMAWWSQRY